MADEISITQASGPVRVRVVSPATVAVSAPPAQSRIRAGGLPGAAGPKGDKGDTGPSGTLEDGVLIDGGNF